MINVSRFFLILLFYSKSLVSAARTKVVIIGAGASGIAAGSKLIENGAFDVKILEAEQRYGGRIYNLYEDGYYKALGAEWTPANDENIVYKMLMEANAINEEWTPKSGIYAKSSGDALLYEQLMPFIEALKNVSPELCEKIKSEDDYYREVFKNIADNEFDENLGRNLPKFMNVSIHFPCDREESLSGDPKQPVRGMKTVLDVLMKAWPNRDMPENWRKMLKLGHKVTKIDWNQQKPSISVKKGNDDVETVFEADYVIVTIPLGVLKNHHSTLFEPNLPENHQKVINNLQVGIENNIYLTFEHQWWPSGHDLFIIWTKTDVQALPKADAWLSKIEGFVPVDNSPVLAVHNMELHDSSSENLPETEVVEKIMAVLKRAFEGKGWNITDPIMVDHSRWGSNPNFLGGVTYNSEKIDVTPFGEPIKNDEGQIVMVFAGEATSERFAGSVHGAVESGFKAAQVLIDHKNR